MDRKGKKIILIGLLFLVINFLFSVLPGEVGAGTTPPGAITNLSALTGSNVGEINLSWSAPGDNGYQDPIVGGKYRIDYSTDPLYNFTTYYYKIEFSTSTSPGDPQSYTLNSLNQTTYYIRVYTADEVPNWSPLSNGATAFPGAPSTGTVTLSASTIEGYINAKDTGGSPAPDEYNRKVSNVDIVMQYGKVTVPETVEWYDRGFIEWDISSIPDDATITDVVFKYQGERNDASSDCSIYQMENQPSAQPDQTAPGGGNNTIWDDAADGNGYVLSHSTFPEVGESKQIDLGSTAVSDLQSNLTTNWFAIGLKNDEGTLNEADKIYSSRYGTVNPAPTLYVTFTYAEDTTPPASITNLSALTGDIGGTVKLIWTAPGDDGTSGDILGGKYRIKYSQDSNYNWNVSDYDIEWTTCTTPGASQSRVVENLTPGATYYFRIWTGDEIPNWSTVSNPANAWAYIEDIDPSTITDLEAKTAVQILLTWTAPGDNGTQGQASFYNIRYSATSPFEWDTATVWKSSRATTGPYGTPETETITGLNPETTYYFRIKAHDPCLNWSLSNQTTAQAGTFQIVGEPMGTEKGVRYSSIAFGDYDNDGDLDLAVSGYDGTNRRLILFKNDNGNFTSDQNPMGGTNKGVYQSYLAFGDYDNDGDLDLAVSGYDDLSNRRLILFKNNNGNFTEDQNPMGGTDKGVYYSSIAFGDYDNDGDLDLAVGGWDDLGNKRLILFKNDNGNFTEAQNPMGGTDGVRYSSIAFGDYDNDGDLDLAVSGEDDLGNRRLIIYKNMEAECDNANTLPGLPQNLTGIYNEGIIKLSWSSATDGGTNPTPQAGLYYNIRVGTGTEVSASSSVVTGIYGSPMMGNYLRPKLTNSVYGVRISSIGLTADTTYYWTVQAIDTSLNAGGWASVESVYVSTVGTPQAPSAITNLSGLTGDNQGEVKLSWSAPGDDGWTGDIIDGRYGIKYATYTTYDFNGPSGFDLEWSTSTSPGNSESKVITGLTGGTTYYFRIWTADEVLNWSGISNGATAWAQTSGDTTSPAAITNLTGLCDSDTGDVTLSWSTPGDDGWNNTLTDGSKYRIDYSTYVIAWSTNTYDVDIPTHSVTPYTEVSHTITGLTGNCTYYFRIWTADEIPNWSGLSNGATVWVNPIISVSISTDTINLGVVEPDSYALTVSSVVVTNNGNIKQKFKLKIVSEPNATWESVTATSPGAEQYRYSGIFCSTQPVTSDFLSEDSFSVSTERTSSSAALARDSDPDDQKGFNVPVDSTRNLWFKFEAPTSTDISTTQAIPLTITAEPYP